MRVGRTAPFVAALHIACMTTTTAASAQSRLPSLRYEKATRKSCFDWLQVCQTKCLLCSRFDNRALKRLPLDQSLCKDEQVATRFYLESREAIPRACFSLCLPSPVTDPVVVAVSDEILGWLGIGKGEVRVPLLISLAALQIPKRNQAIFFWKMIFALIQLLTKNSMAFATDKLARFRRVHVWKQTPSWI